VTQKSLDLFERYNVLSNRELQAREEVLLETYCTKVSIEARTLIQMLSTQVLSAALRYQGELANIVTASTAASVNCNRTSGRLSDVGKNTERIQKSLDALSDAIEIAHDNTLVHAQFIRDTLLPEMLKARVISDELETMIPDDLWPLPSYTEMLFIR
jgi:glutamine synthetase